MSIAIRLCGRLRQVVIAVAVAIFAIVLGPAARPTTEYWRRYAQSIMPLINLTIAHGRTHDEARERLEAAVRQVSSQFAAVIRRVEWTEARDRVKLEGVGVHVEMWVDARDVHAVGDIPLLGALLGGPLASGLKQIVQQTFQKRLP